MASVSTSARPEVPPSPTAGGQTYRGPFAIMTLLFFIWGFVNVLNDILIPQFKEAFTLNYFQAMLAQLAFFGAYSIGGLVYYLISMLYGDPTNRIGYPKGVIIGWLISARRPRRGHLTAAAQRRLDESPIQQPAHLIQSGGSMIENHTQNLNKTL